MPVNAKLDGKEATVMKVSIALLTCHKFYMHDIHITCLWVYIYINACTKITFQSTTCKVLSD